MKTYVTKISLFWVCQYMRSMHVALRKHSLNTSPYHLGQGGILSQFGQKPSGYQSHHEPDFSLEDVKGNGPKPVPWLMAPSSKYKWGSLTEWKVLERSEGISLERAPSCQQSPTGSNPARETEHRCLIRTWEVKGTMTGTQEGRRRAS